MRKAFTLIELLVVISVIAVLAATLFPVAPDGKAANWWKYIADFNDYVESR